jgi:hypothetical protein
MQQDSIVSRHSHGLFVVPRTAFEACRREPICSSAKLTVNTSLPTRFSAKQTDLNAAVERDNTCCNPRSHRTDPWHVPWVSRWDNRASVTVLRMRTPPAVHTHTNSTLRGKRVRCIHARKRAPRLHGHCMRQVRRSRSNVCGATVGIYCDRWMKAGNAGLGRFACGGLRSPLAGL